MKESFRSRLARWGFNHFPAYRRTGARVTYIAADFHEVRITVDDVGAERHPVERTVDPTAVLSPGRRDDAVLGDRPLGAEKNRREAGADEPGVVGFALA